MDDTNAAASRDTSERTAQIEWLWSNLSLQPNARLFDITCGPGLYAVEFAKRGCTVTGVDFNPASIAYARDLVLSEQVADSCTFIEQDIRAMDYRGSNFDAAILLYGQLAVFPPAQAQTMLTNIAQSLQPGAGLCIELLDQQQVDKEHTTWWFTDNSGLWGDGPFLHLGERCWHSDKEVAVEQYHIVHLETGQLSKVQMTDQTYAIETMIVMLKNAGFSTVKAYTAWDGLPLGDAGEWVAYIAKTPPTLP